MLKLYRAALHLYPGEFREESARELALVLRDRLRDEPGLAGRAWIWLHAFTGILIEAPLEHLRVLAEDTRYAVRLLSRERGMALGAIVMLALGIGAATLVFSLANGVLLRPLPFPEPHRLVAIDEQNPADRRYDGTIPFPNFVDLRARARSFVDMGVYADGKTAIRGADGNEPVVRAAVSEGFFATAGVHPVAGRTFTEEELRPQGPAVVVLSWNLYERRFGSNRRLSERRSRPLTAATRSSA
jgi:putative ABC transport system permease protein